MDPSVTAPTRPVTDAIERRGARLWLVVLLTLVADIALTLYGLSLDLVEMNPVATLAIERYGLAGMVGLKSVAVAVGAVGWLVLPAAYARLAPMLLALLWGAAAVINAGVVVVVLL